MHKRAEAPFDLHTGQRAAAPKRLKPSSPSLPSSSLSALPALTAKPSASSSADKPPVLRLLGNPQSAHALLVTPSGHSVPLFRSAPVSIGAKEGLCQLVLSGCPDVAPRQCTMQWSAAHECWQLQVFGRTGCNAAGRHVYPSSMPHNLPGTCALFVCCSNAAHRHLYQLCLPATSRPRAPKAAEEDFASRPEWSDAEQLRFQRSIQSYGLHGLERIKTAAALNKKNREQILNYALAFLLECRKHLTDDSEKLYVDTVVEKEGWQLRHTEPSLAKWKKLQGNASVWVRRLRTIQLLEDIVIRSKAEDVDVLSLLPKSALRLSEGAIPAPWWTNAHDRALLLGVYEHGFCKYDDLRTDRKYRFLIGRHWIAGMAQWEAAQINSRTGKPKKSKKKKADTDDDDALQDDDDEDDKMDLGGDDEAGGGGEEGRRGEGAGGAVKSDEELLDVCDNSYGILFPPADLLTKRMRRLVENQRKLWWRRRDPLDVVDRPVRLKRKARRDEAAAVADERADAASTRQQRLVERSNTPWTESAVQRLLEAVLMHGVEKDQFGRIRWEKHLAHCQLPSEAAADAERVLMHILEDHFIGVNAPSLSFLTVFSLPIISHRPIIPIANSSELSARLLFFSKLRTRLLPLSHYTLSSLLDTHRPDTPADAPLPDWYEPAAHDVCLMRGVGKWGVGAWQQLVDDEALGWQGGAVKPASAADSESKSAVDDAADEEVQSINRTTPAAAGSTATTPKQPAAQQPSIPTAAESNPQSSPRPLAPLHYSSLWQRVQDLVDSLYPLAPVNQPLSTTFSALCPLIHAESSKERRKREAAAREAQEVGLKRPSKKAAKASGKVAVSIYSITESEMAQSFYHFVPSLTRYQRYMVQRRLPLTDTVSPFDVTPLSVTAVSNTHPTWKPLVRHRKVSSALVSAAGIDPTALGGAPPTLYICGDVRDEVAQLSPQHAAHRLYFSASTKQLLLPMWLLGGLTVYALGRLDARCQCVDDRDQRSVYLCPVGYRAVRVHQSALDPNKMARYLCEVIEEEGSDEDVRDRWEQAVRQQRAGDAQVKAEEEGGSGGNSEEVGAPVTLPSDVLPRRRVMFRVTSSDSPHTPLVSYSPHSAWQLLAGLLYDVADCSLISRRNDAPGGWERFGLTHPLVRHCLEQLPGVEQCVGYSRQGPINVQRYEIVDEPQQQPPPPHATAANNLQIRVDAA